MKKVNAKTKKIIVKKILKLIAQEFVYAANNAQWDEAVEIELLKQKVIKQNDLDNNESEVDKTVSFIISMVIKELRK
jgi:hypothetical protein